MLKLKLMKTPISAKRLAANRANAARSTGPRTPAGKARSSQNRRKFSFDPGNYAMVRAENPETIAHLRADALDFYQPVNSQEMFAVERIALAQHGMLRVSFMEAGLFTNCLEEALDCNGKPVILRKHDLTDGLQLTVGQNHNYWLACGFRTVLSRQPLTFTFMLRYQAQAERLYRRAVEDFDRLKKLRTEFDTEPMLDPQAVQPDPVPPPETNPPEPPSEPPAAAPEPAPQPTPTAGSPACPSTPVSTPELLKISTQNGAARSIDPPKKVH